MQRDLPRCKSRVGVLCKGACVSCSIVMLLSRRVQLWTGLPISNSELPARFAADLEADTFATVAMLRDMMCLLAVTGCVAMVLSQPPAWKAWFTCYCLSESLRMICNGCRRQRQHAGVHKPHDGACRANGSSSAPASAVVCGLGLFDYRLLCLCVQGCVFVNCRDASSGLILPYFGGIVVKLGKTGRKETPAQWCGDKRRMQQGRVRVHWD